MTYGKESKETALSWLISSARLLEHGCLGHIPEILDGDYPHSARGCDAPGLGSQRIAARLVKTQIAKNKIPSSKHQITNKSQISIFQ